MAEVIASAIALPDSEDLVDYSANNGLKRRQSEISGDDDGDSGSKRQRTSPGKTSPRSRSKGAEREGAGEEVISSVARARSITPVESKNGNGAKPETPAQDSRDGRRKSSAVKGPDEKQRSKRLFGALLGNLNRPSDRQSKRRAEIEQRKKAELQKQDDERLEDRQRRLERLAIQRQNEQVQVDERDMHIRHKNLLSSANFLQTRTEPKLYYRPWDLLADEEDQIERQLEEAQAQIDQELVEWEDEKRKRLGMTTNPSDASNIEEAANKNTTPLESDTKKDKEVPAVENTNARSEAEATAGAAGLEKSAEVPDSVPTSPQQANSVIEEKEVGNVIKSEDARPEPQDMAEDEEDKKDRPKDAEEPETTASVDTKTATNGDAKEELDDDGDHVVEGDEDDVIY